MNIESFVTTECFRNSIIDIVLKTKNIIENSEISITKKGQGNFVTSVDIDIERYLRESLSHILPQAGFLAEETEPIMQNDVCWIIDPIDGTSNFIYGFEYTVSLALQVNNNIIIGIIYVPTQNQLYIATAGSGAYKLCADGQYIKIFVKEFSASEGVLLFGLPYNRKKSDKIFTVANKLYTIASDIKRIGPASLDICRIAEGIGKLYFELDLEIWDVAAGKLILTEAGGEFCKLDDLFLFGSKPAIEDAKNVLRFRD